MTAFIRSMNDEEKQQPDKKIVVRASAAEKEIVFIEPSKRDWKHYREKLPEWQEHYMERLIGEYIACLNRDEKASDKFWKIEKRVEEDKKKPGVCIEVKRGTMIFDLVHLLQDGVIGWGDLEGFSDEVRETVTFLWERFRE